MNTRVKILKYENTKLKIRCHNEYQSENPKNKNATMNTRVKILKYENTKCN